MEDLRMVSTSDVLDRHLKCFAEHDVDGILADYSSDAVLFVPDGPLSGGAKIVSQIRANRIVPSRQ
jgi:ketosteroid isomerase-like protein